MGLYFTFPLTILIEVAFPFALAFWVIRHFHTSWRLVGFGGLIYLVAEMVHIALLDGVNWLYSSHTLTLPTGTELIILNAVIGGIAAALCIETARLIGFKILKQPVQNIGGALSLGVGSAGIESIVVAGLPMLGTFVSMVAYKSVNLQDPTLDQATLAQLASLWQMPWLTPLASALERLVAMMTQVTLTFIVLQVFIKKSYWYFGAALLWHAMVDGLIIGLVSTSLTGEAILAIEVVLALISAGILWWLLAKPNIEGPGTSVDQLPVKV